MHWVRWVLYHHTVWSFALATMLHLAAIAIVLTFAPTRPMMRAPESLIIEFAEIELAPPPPEVPIEPLEATPPPEPSPSKSEPAPASVARPPTAPDAINAPSTAPNVLTQNTPGDAAPADGETGEETDTVSDAQIANVLKLLGCQKLRDHRDEHCPDADPFTASAAVAERNSVQPKEWADSDYINKPVIEQFYEREVLSRFHWPDADLFTDPMPPGAYNAQRIRDGREPLWNKKMRDGFRKKETDED